MLLRANKYFAADRGSSEPLDVVEWLRRVLIRSSGLPAVLCAAFVAVANPAGATSEFGNYLAGRHAQALKDAENASAFMMRVLEENPEDQKLLRRAFLLTLAAGQVEPAVALAQRIEKAGGKMTTAALLLGIEAVRAGDFTAARDCFEALPRSGLTAYAAPLAIAWTQVGLGDTDAALKALEPLDKKSGFAAMRDLHAGLINDVAGRPEAAEQSFRAVAPTLHKAPVRVVRAAGSLLERTGRATEAKKLYADFLADNPGNLAIEAAQNRLNAAQAAAPLVQNANSGIAESLFNIASALPRDRSGEIAMIYAYLALRLRPDFDLARLLLGDLFDNQRRYTDANAVYAQVKKVSPYNWSARLRIADNLTDLKQVDDAVEMLRAMAEERPERTDALIKLGGILRGKERYREAVDAYDAAGDRLNTNGNAPSWLFYYNRGIALERSKLWDRAEKDFLKALELEPEQPYVLNYLGYSWVEKGINVERARKMIERAVEQRQNDGYIVDSLGWVLYRLGDYAGSVKHLERAIRLRPSDPVINDHLGDAYWRVGRKLEARFQWRRALGLDPSDDLISTIEDKLVKGLGAMKLKESGG
ncbi:MAG: tetratricopeptide repeat protein [Alphaproteobacteria bacterium]|nr:tetratricopeptide repeat protein [Alphaproteobacteria bacterium]